MSIRNTDIMPVINGQLARKHKFPFVSVSAVVTEYLVIGCNKTSNR